MNILDSLLEIENDKNIYQYVFSYKNILMYPCIRFKLLQRAIEDIYGSSPPDSFKVGKLQKIKYLFKSLLYKPRGKLQSDIVFFGSNVPNIIVNDIYFNRLTDCFANEYMSKTLLIESSYRLNYSRPRAYPRVFSNDFINIFADYRIKIDSIVKSKKPNDLIQIDSFLEYLKKCFNHKFSGPGVWETLRNDLIHYSLRIQYLYKSYLKLIKQVSPKIIMLLDACYGNTRIPIILAAKELNIPIAEYQHGVISLSHPAYNYSEQLPDCYKQYMPDFYLSYGKYWTENSRIPIKVIEIGNPYLFETASRLSLSKQYKKKEQVLYISSAISPEQYVLEVIQLNASLADKGYLVIFRIHPSETARLQTVYKPLIDAGIQIDTQPLYETLNNTKYLIGDFSTVLFEATIFDCVIFVRDTPLNRANMDITRFNAISSINEMIEKVNSGEYQYADRRDFWQDDWRDRYKKFMSSYLKDETI